MSNLMKSVRKNNVPFQPIVLLMIVLQSCSCSGSGDTDAPDNGDHEKEVEIRVGTKTITTNKFTPGGTPVVPMWDAPLATSDLRNGAGFEVLDDAEHTYVWQPKSLADGAFNHYSCLIYYKGQFFAMWGNHEFGEDGPGQRVLYARSDGWGNWTDVEEVFPAPGPVKPRNERGIHLKPDRWIIIDDILYAVTYVHGAGRYPIARSVDEEGLLGEPFLVNNLPNNGELPIYMQDTENPDSLLPIAGRIRAWYRENNQVSWWAWGSAEWGVPNTAIDGAQLIENIVYPTNDGKLALLMRYWGHTGNPVHNNRMYVSFNDGTGGWDSPYPTDIPDSPSRAQAITLDDGTILLIGNQTAPYFDEALYLDRDPMTISISKDGYTFDRVYALHTGSPTDFRFSGIGGRNPGYAYSSSVVHEGYLYTLYSIGKEDLGITRLPLATLDLQ